LGFCARSGDVTYCHQIGGYLRWSRSIKENVVAKPKEEASAGRMRGDGRRQLLIYMSPDLIKELKRAALDEDRPAYELAEEAIVDLLKRRKRTK
jgi:hypothetical protein